MTKNYGIPGEHAKRPSATKKGPGRYHKQGHQKNSPAKGTKAQWKSR